MVYPPYDTEDKRRDLLAHYMVTEPDIYVNGMPYRVEVAYHDPEYVSFYAICKNTQSCGAISKVTRTSWERIDNGLGMCYLLNEVLYTLEQGVTHTGGKVDPALIS